MTIDGSNSRRYSNLQSMTTPHTRRIFQKCTPVILKTPLQIYKLWHENILILFVRTLKTTQDFIVTSKEGLGFGGGVPENFVSVTYIRAILKPF